MALDDVRHVEAVAIMNALLDGDPDGTRAARAWCAENHPPPSAYVAAMTHIAERGRMTEPEHVPSDPGARCN